MIDRNVLAQRVVLAYLNISVWSGSKRDKGVAQEIAAMKKAAPDAGSYTKRLVPKEIIDVVNTAAQAVRVYYYKNTVSWDDNGARALPVVRWFEYQAGIEEYIANFYGSVNKFCEWYRDNWNSYQTRLGQMFNPKEYPYPEEIIDRFKLQTSYRQIMTPDFRVELPDEINEAIKTSTEEGFKAGLKMAEKECWARIAESMEKVAEKLEDEKGIFRDSLIENVNILVATLRPLNIGGSQELDNTLNEMIESVGKCFPDWLRVDAQARAKAAAAARKIFELASLRSA